MEMTGRGTMASPNISGTEVSGPVPAGLLRGVWLVVLLLMVLGLSACNTSESSSDFIDDIEPGDRLYNQALADMDDGNMKDASKSLEKIQSQHPYSEYSRRAMVMQTFISYRRRQYDDAINSGKRYVALYPGDKDAAYAQYLVGMSYFRQIPDISRDQSVAGRAYNAMNEVVERYPESEYVEDAKAKMRVALDQLAGKQMLTGRYYLERREYLAAINRFRYVVERFQTTRHVEEALARLAEAYLAIGIVNEAQTAAAVLGHNFPDSVWYKDTVALLEKQGAAPSENAGSWISQSFQQQPPESG